MNSSLLTHWKNISYVKLYTSISMRIIIIKIIRRKSNSSNNTCSDSQLHARSSLIMFIIIIYDESR